MNVLTPAQRAFLSKFFDGENARAFYLTGGGALAEFYLEHRLSQDIDLFTQDRKAWEAIESDLKAAAEAVGASFEFKASKEQNELHRAFIQVPGEAKLKIDLVRDAPPHFGELNVQPDGIIVDALENIAVGKLLALYGRGYPRDFVDLYFLLNYGLDIDRLLVLGKEKDPGLFEFYLAGMMQQVVEIESDDLPPMLKPLDLESMKQFFLALAGKLAAGQ